jgi:hypothetical protein
MIGGMQERNFFPKNLQGAWRVVALTAITISVLLLPDRWFWPAIGMYAGAFLIYEVARRVNQHDDPRHAKDDRQTRRDQEQRRSAGKTGQELDEVKGHFRSAPGASLSSLASSFETARQRRASRTMRPSRLQWRAVTCPQPTAPTLSA